MSRFRHYLKRNEGCETVHNAIWLDTETTQHPDPAGGVVHRLAFGWCAYRQREPGGAWSEPIWQRFASQDEGVNRIVSRSRPHAKLYVFVHNGGFDYIVLGLFDRMAAMGWVLKKAVIESPPLILEYRKGDRTILFLDTLNWWRTSLKQLGHDVGVAKLDMPASWHDTERADEYCRRDVEIIMVACIRWWDFLRRNDLGGFAPTLAAQSMRTYRHKFMTVPILIDTDTRALELSRSAYYGGRCECYHIGEVCEPLYVLDVNSMYPYVMRARPYPTELLHVSLHPTPWDLGRWLRDHMVVADVTLDTETAAYPVRHGNKLVFPVGRFRTVLATPECRQAHLHNHIVTVHRVAVYAGAEIFTSYVDYMYEHRLRAAREGNATDAMGYKLLLNSLYGKFGQEGRVFEEIGTTDDLTPRIWDEIDAATGAVTTCRQLGGLMQRLSHVTEARESHPAIAAHVTSYAREYLNRLISGAGRDHVYYVDTDSLVVDQTGYDRLAQRIDPTRLGWLKIENTADRATIWGPKDYKIGVKEKHKGVRAAAIWTGPADVTQERWPGIKTMLRQGDLSHARTIPIDKHLKRVYTKGIVRDSGVVCPIAMLDDWCWTGPGRS